MNSKKSQLLSLVLSLSLTLVLSFAYIIAHAENKKVVSIATLNTYPPFCFAITATGLPPTDGEILHPGHDSKFLQGISWDVVREAYHANGYTIKLLIVPWARSEHLLAQGTVDGAFPMTINEERNKLYYSTKNPTDQINFVIYTYKDSPIKWNGLSSLNGLTVGVSRGWSYGDKFDKTTSFKRDISSDNVMVIFAKLEAKRVDAIAGYEMSSDQELMKAGKINDFIKFPPFDSSKEVIYSSKKKGRLFVDAFDEGYEIIKSNGKLAKINDKWK